MAFRRRRFSGRRRPGRRPTTFRRFKAKVRRASVKRVVKQVLARDVETKSAETGQQINRLYYPTNLANFMVLNIMRISPGNSLPINQGTGNGARVGNRCRIRRLMFNMQIRPRPYDNTDNNTPKPQVGKVVLFYMRKTPTAVNTTGNEPVVDFFQLGNTTDAIKGQLIDQMQNYNTDKYRVFASRTFKVGFSQYEGDGLNSGSQAFANNDFKYAYQVKWDVTKYVPKLLRYNDDDVTPLSRALYAMVYYSPADGSTGSSTQIPLTCTWWVQCKYEDA